MNRIFCRIIGAVGLLHVVLLPAHAVAAENQSAVVTDMRNHVFRQPVNGQERPAQLKDTLKAADVLRTAERSFAEMEFTDKTLVRLGSRSTFALPSDTKQLQAAKGLMLVCVPKGHGGRQIVTAAVTAAIEGTTVLTEEMERHANQRQGSKIIFIEGNGVLHRNQHRTRIHGGQMVIVHPDDSTPPQVVDVDLNALVSSSRLLQMPGRPLPTSGSILDTMQQQQREITRGFLEPTGFQIGGTGPNRQFSLFPRSLPTAPSSTPPAPGDLPTTDPALLQPAQERRFPPLPPPREVYNWDGL